MKLSGISVCVMLFCSPFVAFCQGTSCTTPIPITMDGVCRNYTISSATGANIVCTPSGTTPITYFSIVANSSAQNMLLKITGPGNQPVEVAFYKSTSCTNGNLESSSSICFYDGTGYWAPAEDFVITPNQTYIFRIKTATTGSIQICGQYYTPPNNNCSGATQLSDELVFDNNAAHKPGTGVSPVGLCADALENTAFYTYTVATTGPTGISLENLTCDNNYESNLLNLGFQLGLFRGSCAGLTNLTCYVGVGANAQFTAGSLPAGTQVYVAIDGILASNCEYSIRAINAVVLAATIKSFTAWKTEDANILNWVSLREDANAFFEIQRSVDGSFFETIDRVAGQINSTTEKSYQVTDASPPTKCFYRLKLISTGGTVSYSNVIRVDRRANVNSKVKFANIVTDLLSLKINDLRQDKILIKIVDPSGRELYKQNTPITNGENIININTGKFSGGLYYLLLSGQDYRESFPFIKS